MVALRMVEAADVGIYYRHQLDPEAVAMAAFPSRSWDDFRAAWSRSLADPEVVTRTVVCDGEVAGNVLSWRRDGRRLVGYWLGREFWGRGVATRALQDFVALVDERPLHAIVARHNLGSRRVLEKCGFRLEREQTAADGVEELLLRLDPGGPEAGR